MTIKEIEQLSGMTRANIRYYETEGFLTPTRAENGYRDYSPDDLQTLQRIRLLRSLGMSIEGIKEVQSGRLTLSASLYQLEQELSQTQEQLDWAKEICRALRQENVTYETLYAPRYFDRLPPAEQDNTAEPPFRGPWRRFFARYLDLFVYESVITLAGIFLFRMTPQQTYNLSLLWTLLSVVVMMVLEPMLLYRFGTTFGKWVFGLRITDPDGRLPDYEQVRRRTWGVLWWGHGLFLPVFSLVRMAISYHDASQDRDSHWEDETVQLLRKPPRRRYVLAGVIYGALTAAVLLVPQVNDRVPYRGPLTVENYCYNHNSLSDYYEGGTYLYPDGTFRSAPYFGDTSGSGQVEFGDYEMGVVFEETRDGMMESAELTIRYHGEYVSQHSATIRNMLLAAVKARNKVLSDEGEKLAAYITEVQPMQDYSGTMAGVAVDLDWETYGYLPDRSNGVLQLVKEAEDAYAVMTLTLTFAE